jgi:hypothetical protein
MRIRVEGTETEIAAAVVEKRSHLPAYCTAYLACEESTDLHDHGCAVKSGRLSTCG